MKRSIVISAAAMLALLLVLVPVVSAQQGNQIIPGTQVRLTLTNGVSTAVAHDGDPFTAIVAEPVFSGNQLLLPAGSKVHGVVHSVDRPKFFSMFRGGASMSLTITSVEVESRIFPAKMSILSIYSGEADAAKSRKDLKTVEGEVVEENRGVKADVEDVAIGTAGGSTVGLIFSHVLRGTVIGLVGGTVYVVAKKGKDVELPAQTNLLVRLDTPLALPDSILHNASYVTTGH